MRNTGPERLPGPNCDRKLNRLVSTIRITVRYTVQNTKVTEWAKNATPCTPHYEERQLDDWLIIRQVLSVGACGGRTCGRFHVALHCLQNVFNVDVNSHVVTYMFNSEVNYVKSSQGAIRIPLGVFTPQLMATTATLEKLPLLL